MEDNEKEIIFREIQKKFPVMNIIDCTTNKPEGVYIERRIIKDYIVFIEIGISNVNVWSIHNKGDIDGI